jgi:hypothetical protein
VSLSSPALICTLLTNRKSDEHRLHKTPNERTGLVRQPSKNPLPTFSKKERKVQIGLEVRTRYVKISSLENDNGG